MTTDDQTIQDRMTRFEQACRDAGVKLTHQRLEIFREIARSTDHPDAETVYRGVRERIPTMSLDTVYRSLRLLSDLGLIATLGPSRDRARFDVNLDRHHHFVCVRCGLTRDFYSDEFDELKLPRSIRAFGRVETTHVEARGVCRDCADSDTSQPTTSRKNVTHEGAREDLS